MLRQSQKGERLIDSVEVYQSKFKALANPIRIFRKLLAGFQLRQFGVNKLGRRPEWPFSADLSIDT